MKASQSIYYANFGSLQKPLRLNLRAINDLLPGRPPVAHFRELTARDKAEVQARFCVYCQHGRPDFNSGGKSTAKIVPPAIDNLPNKDALRKARGYFFPRG